MSLRKEPEPAIPDHIPLATEPGHENREIVIAPRAFWKLAQSARSIEVVLDEVTNGTNDNVGDLKVIRVSGM